MPRDRARILVVDTSKSDCDFVSDLASLYNYEIVCAGDPEQALKFVEDGPVDSLLVAMDVEGGGFLLGQQIRALDGYEDLPVMFLAEQEPDALTLMEAQFYGGLFVHQKPFEEVGLLAQLSTMVRIKFLQDELKDRMNELDRLASTDVLTGLYNRRMFFIRFEEELARARRAQSGMCVVYIDIDHFKKINDTYGHQAGDEILKRISNIMNNHLRKSDVLGRIGGEEFAVLLPDTPGQAGELIANRLREDVQDTSIEYDGQVIPVTISLGVFFVPDPRAYDIDELIRNADESLYEAKDTGRNKVILRLGEAVAGG